MSEASRESAEVAGQPPQRSSTRNRWIALVIAAVLIVGVGGTLLVLNAVGAFAEEVEVQAEPVNTPGVNPFMPPVGTDTPPAAPVNNPGQTVSGDTPALYGGTLNSATCDPDKMVNFLRANPEKAQAWARVQGIQASDIPNYVAGLTPLILRVDTRVTNHGFANGQPTTVNSVLEAGTAVLVDRYGVPRSRCECGNPLTAPPRFSRESVPPTASQSTAPRPTDRQRISRERVVGPTWRGFTQTNIIVVQQTIVVINLFIIVDIHNNVIIYRPAGTRGEQDRQTIQPLLVPAPFTTTATSRPAERPPQTSVPPRRSSPNTTEPPVQEPPVQEPPVQEPPVQDQPDSNCC